MYRICHIKHLRSKQVPANTRSNQVPATTFKFLGEKENLEVCSHYTKFQTESDVFVQNVV